MENLYVLVDMKKMKLPLDSYILNDGDEKEDVPVFLGKLDIIAMPTRERGFPSNLDQIFNICFAVC
jgi:hypothetical protein